MDNNEKFKAFVMESNTKKGIKIIDKSFLDDGDVFVKFHSVVLIIKTV